MEWPAWPEGSAPDVCPVFVCNQYRIAAPPGTVWRWLVRADLWPAWFAGASKVRFEDGGGPTLALGTRVTWRMLNATIRVQVKVCEPPRLLDWEGGAAGVHAYHAWLLEPDGAGTRVVTEETERGPLPWLLRWYLRGALHGAHERWLESLAQIAVTGEPGTARV